MIIIMQKGASEHNIQKIYEQAEKAGLDVDILKGTERTIIVIENIKEALESSSFELNDGVEKIIPIGESYKLAGRNYKSEPTIVEVGEAEIGGEELVLIAGPCAVEHPDQIFAIADTVKKAGGKILRGGAYKPRTSPYSFRGLGEEGLKLLAEAGNRNGLAVVTEIIEVNHIDIVAQYADMLQIGSRNMYNYQLLKEVGRLKKPVLLKRGLSATIEEWLNAAEYIMNEGNYEVVLCERGIRTFETQTRNTLDISAVPIIKELSHLPIIVDPSHGTGKWNLVPSMSCASVAAGADGLMIEIHPNPNEALSDGFQSLNFDSFIRLTEQLKKVAIAMGRSFG